MKPVLFFLIVGLGTSANGHAQVADSTIIAQASPELCGREQGGVILPPSGTTVTIDRSTDHATLSIPISGSIRTIELPGVVSYVAQVCPLSDGRIVVFGNAYQAMNITILDTKTGSMLDHIDCVHPSMSPDQHWMAYEEFYPAHTELPVTSKYRLYDLTKNAAENRVPGVSTDESVSVGTVVFPVVANGSDSERQHEARLGSFAWAPDSKAFAFEDQVDGKRSVVLVTIDNAGRAIPLVFQMNAAQVCSTNEVSNEQFIWDSLKLEVTSNPNRIVNVSISGVKGCSSKPTIILLQDFTLAESDHSIPPKKTSVKVR